MTHLGEVIRRLRHRKQWTQEDLGSRCGITGSAVCQIERGRSSHPTAHHLATMATALDASVDHILQEAGLLPVSPDTRRVSPSLRRLIRLIESIPQEELKDQATELLISVVEGLQRLEATAGRGSPYTIEDAKTEEPADEQPSPTPQPNTAQTRFKPFCTQCGGKREKSDVYCGWCGQRLNDAYLDAD